MKGGDGFSELLAAPFASAAARQRPCDPRLADTGRPHDEQKLSAAKCLRQRLLIGKVRAGTRRERRQRPENGHRQSPAVGVALSWM